MKGKLNYVFSIPFLFLKQLMRSQIQKVDLSITGIQATTLTWRAEAALTTTATPAPPLRERDLGDSPH